MESWQRTQRENKKLVPLAKKPSVPKGHTNNVTLSTQRRSKKKIIIDFSLNRIVQIIGIKNWIVSAIQISVQLALAQKEELYSNLWSMHCYCFCYCEDITVKQKEGWNVGVKERVSRCATCILYTTTSKMNSDICGQMKESPSAHEIVKYYVLCLG